MKRSILILVVLSTMLIAGCSTNKKDDVSDNKTNNTVENVEKGSEEEEVEVEEKVYNEFIFLDNTYTRNEDITTNSIETEIVNSDKPYQRGQFIEVDFAYDIINEYLSGNAEVFNHIITLSEESEIGYEACTQDEKNNLDESIKFLREQMYLYEDAPIYFRPSKVVYLGNDENIEESVVVKVYGHISGDNINFVSLSSYTITIIKGEGKILANIV